MGYLAAQKASLGIMLGCVVSLNYAIASLRDNVWVLGSEEFASSREHLDLSLAAPVDFLLARGKGNPWSKTWRVEVHAASGHLKERWSGRPR